MPPDYYSPRYLVLAAASIAVALYFLIYSYWVNKHAFILIQDPILDVNDLLLIESLIVVVICVLCLPGILFNFKDRINIPSLEWFIKTPTRNVILLVTTSVFFIALISIPAFFMGGATKSNFAVLLIAMATLVVVVTNNPWIRISLASVACSSFILSSIFFVDIEIKNERTYSNFYTATSIFAVLLALLLSWRGEFSIFGKTDQKTPEDFLSDHLAPQLQAMAIGLHQYILSIAPQSGPVINSKVFDKWNKRIIYQVAGRDAFCIIEPRASTLNIEFTNASEIGESNNLLKNHLLIFEHRKHLKLKFPYGMRQDKIDEVQKKIELLQPIIESAVKNAIEEPLPSKELSFPVPTSDNGKKPNGESPDDES